MMDQATSGPAADQGFAGLEGGLGFGGFLKITKGKGGTVPSVKSEDGSGVVVAVGEEGFINGHVFGAGSGGEVVFPEEELGQHGRRTDILSAKRNRARWDERNGAVVGLRGIEAE